MKISCKFFCIILIVFASSILFISCASKTPKTEANKNISVTTETTLQKEKLLKAMEEPVDSGKLQERINKWKEVLSENSNDADAHFQLGMAYASSFMLDDAIKEYENCLKLKPDHGEATMNLGVQYSQRGLHDKALSTYKNFLKHSKDDTFRQTMTSLVKMEEKTIAGKNKGLSEYEINTQSVDKYNKELEQSVSKNPNDYNSHYQIGTMHQIAGEIDEAEKEFKTVLKINPQCADKCVGTCLDVCLSHNALGQIYEAKDKMKESVSEYKLFVSCIEKDKNIARQMDREIQITRGKIEKLSGK